MSATSDRPRLDKIDPEEFANEVHDAVVRHLQRLAAEVGHTCNEEQPSAVKAKARALAEYAAMGADLDAPLAEHIQSLAEAIWRRPGDEVFALPLLRDGASELVEDNIFGRATIVIKAALVREKLDAAQQITAGELAIMASRSDSHINLLCRQQQIKAIRMGPKGWAISAGNARQWLHEREVFGF